MTPADIDCASIYNSFTITVLETIEDLGFCEKGKGGAFVADQGLRGPDGRLPFNTDGGDLLPRCTSCQTVVWFPRAFCPACHTEGVEWIAASGAGTVYSHTVIHKGDGPWRDVSPFVLAYVELDEGPRVLTNIVECDPETVTVGQRVSVRWDPTDKGPAIYRFAPAG